MAGDTPDISTMWQRFSTPMSAASLGIPQVSCDATNSVAKAAVEAAGLIVSGGRAPGGDLGAIDIKRMDVKTAISMSLMHEFVKNGILYELVADNTSDGVRFVEIGSGGGSIGTEYYRTQTTSYSNPLKDVLVTGGKPLPKIEFKGWHNVLTTSEIFTQRDMLENCRKESFKRYATIVYKDPHLDTTYKDGIDNLYEINGPWDKVVGYVHYKNPGKDLSQRTDVTVSWSQESKIPYQINKKPGDSGSAATTGSVEINLNTCPEVDMGNIQEIKNYDKVKDAGGSCFSGMGTAVKVTDGILVTVPEKWRYETVRKVKKDNLIRVSNVYLVGCPIDLLFYAPKEAKNIIEVPPTVEKSVLWASINQISYTTYKLEEGKHYAVATKGQSDTIEYYIIFGKETRNGDPFKYGKNTQFRLDPLCNVARKMTGVGSQPTEFKGTIFPITKTTGILVAEIWVEVDVDTPCINIYDPEGMAYEIAKKFEYHLCPVVATEEPSPMANKSGKIDQEPDVKDADPTTMQNFRATPLESVLDNMGGAGMSVNWSFLETERDVATAASNLYGLMSDTTVETVLTCGPDANPELGSGLLGGSINSIRYAYTDQNSYTVSITVGPKLPPSSIVSVDGGPTPMMMENISAKGTIIASAGDNVNFKVRIDGYGERWAMCMCPAILRVGDVVQCSVHNNPIEY